MSNLLSRYIVLTVLFFLFFTPQVCRANPIVIDPVEIGGNALLFLLFDAFVDLVVLAVSFALVRELGYFNIYDFPRYFLAVVVGGLFIDLIAIIVTHEQLAFMVLLATLVGYNISLCRSYFGLAFVKAAFIGLMVGFLTNPFIWMFLLPFGVTGGGF